MTKSRGVVSEFRFKSDWDLCLSVEFLEWSVSIIENSIQYCIQMPNINVYRTEKQVEN